MIRTRNIMRSLPARAVRLGAWVVKAKFTHGAAVLLLDEDSNVLLVEEKIRDRGRWGLPGGFAKFNETFSETAIRELLEETGIELQPADLQLMAEYRQQWAWHYDHIYIARINHRTGTYAARKISRDISQSRWFDLDRLPSLTQATEESLKVWRESTKY